MQVFINCFKQRRLLVVTDAERHYFAVTVFIDKTYLFTYLHSFTFDKCINVTSRLPPPRSYYVITHCDPNQ